MGVVQVRFEHKGSGSENVRLTVAVYQDMSGDELQTAVCMKFGITAEDCELELDSTLYTFRSVLYQAKAMLSDATVTLEPVFTVLDNSLPEEEDEQATGKPRAKGKKIAKAWQKFVVRAFSGRIPLEGAPGESIFLSVSTLPP